MVIESNYKAAYRIPFMKKDSESGFSLLGILCGDLEANGNWDAIYDKLTFSLGRDAVAKYSVGGRWQRHWRVEGGSPAQKK